MFEKYHLIHCAIKKSMTGSTGELLSVQEGKPTSSDDLTIEWSDHSAQSTGTQNATYCFTGSFDMLMPPAVDCSNGLYLQELSVMHSRKGTFMKRSDYPSLLISYTYAGEGKLSYEGRNYQLQPGQLFLIDCRVPHEYSTVKEVWEHVDIHLWGTNAVTIYRHFRDRGIVHLAFSQEGFTFLTEGLLDACTKVSDHRSLFISNALLNMLCPLLEHAEKESHSATPAAYKKAIEYMEANYMLPLSLDTLASLVNVSKYHFSREFRKYTGASPNDYLLNLRMKHACILLVNTDLPIEQIAREVGIHNMSNFITLFKKRVRMTPSAIRKSKGENLPK